MASAERILHKYILPGTEYEMRIPDRIAFDIQVDVQEKITNQGRDDSEVFEQVKYYIFQVMEGHYPSVWATSGRSFGLSPSGARFVPYICMEV